MSLRKSLRLPMVPVLALLIALGVTACGEHDDDHDHDHDNGHDHDHDHDHGGLYPRLLIADADEPTVMVLDLKNNEIIETLAVEAPARVYAAPNGRFGFAVQGSADLTQVIDAGVWRVDHDDHDHVYERAPKLLDFEIEAAKPTDFAANGEQVGIFNDVDGSADVFSVSEVTKSSPAVRRHQTAYPHHGIAVPMGEYTVISKADEDGNRVGVEVRSADDTIVETFEPCDSLHGWAARPGEVFFGCEHGVLAIKQDGETFTSTSINGSRVGTLEGHPEQQYLIGDLRPDRDGITRINVSAGTIEPLVLGSRVRSYAMEPEHGKEVFVLTDDGAVHVVDIADWEVEQKLENVISQLESGPWGTLVAGDHVVFVADPSQGLVVELHFEDHELEIEAAHDVGGKPASLALVNPLED